MGRVATESNLAPAPGARPAGTSTPTEAAENIQQMFSAIAPTYDRANHILSAGLDRTWWNRAARTLRPILQRPEAVIVDLCCGTGDMTLALHHHRPQSQSPGAPSMTVSPSWVGSQTSTTPGAPHLASETWVSTEPSPILAIDFSAPMLALATQKFAPRNILTLEADALHLPLADNSVDLVTSAFGFRNLTSYPAGLAEIHRILAPGGQLAILECNQPTGITGFLYSLYFQRILPTLGGLISGRPRAYAYLPDSVLKFPRPPEMLSLLHAANFTNPTWTAYTLGTVGLYRATKP